jgi:hypothetical protein
MLDSAYQLTTARYLRPKSSAIKQHQLNRVTLVQMDNVLISTCVENRHTYIYKVLSINDENNSLTSTCSSILVTMETSNIDTKLDRNGVYLLVMLCYVSVLNSATQGYDSAMMVTPHQPYTIESHAYRCQPEWSSNPSIVHRIFCLDDCHDFTQCCRSIPRLSRRHTLRRHSGRQMGS